MKKILGLSIAVTFLSACGGDPESSKNIPDTLIPDDFVYSSASSSSEPNDNTEIINQSLPFYESFSATNTRHLFSTNYKSLNSNPELSFYHATGGFGENYTPEANTTSWLTANPNPKMRLSNGRFTIGQSQQDNENQTVNGTSKIIPGEFDLSEPYTISFCVNQASGGGNLEIYVDNNTTGANNSLHGSGNASRIAQQQASTLKAGERFSISIPNQVQVKQIGTSTSFLQFRVSSGGNVVFDDLIIETQSKPYTGVIPECIAEDGIDPEPEVVPATPQVTLLEGDKQITVNWPHSGVGASYEVFYNTTNSLEGAYGLSENPMTDNSVTITDLENGQEYWIFVRANNAVGSSEWSLAKSAVPTAPPAPDLEASRTFKIFTKPDDQYLQGTGDPAALVTGQVVVTDLLNFFNKSGSALRFRAAGVWNFNSSSFVDSATVMVADGEVQSGELRSYIEIPITVGREVTLTYRMKRTSSNAGKIAFITDGGIVHKSIAVSGEDTSVFDETFTLLEGHNISSLKLVYSREGGGSGGLDLISLRKHYAGESTPELDRLTHVDYSWNSFVLTDYTSILDEGTSNVAVKNQENEHSINGLVFLNKSGSALRHRGSDYHQFNFNGSGWASGNDAVVQGDVAPGLRAYIGVPVSDNAVEITVVHRNSSSSATAGSLVFIGSDNAVLKVSDSMSNSPTTTTLSLPKGHGQTMVKVVYSRDGASGGGAHIVSISRTHN